MERIITWFVDNPVAANLMMLIFIAAGTISLRTLHQEQFPNVELDVVQIQVAYLGAAPVEVESAVCIRIEEAVEGTEGIKRMSTVAAEGMCSVTIELEADVDSTHALNDIKGKVDAISTFPRETEKPVISRMAMRGRIIMVNLSGAADELTLKLLAETMRDDIAAMDGVSISFPSPRGEGAA